MTATFMKRLSASLVDIIIVIIIIYIAFAIGGRSLLQSRVENFDEIYETYNKMIVVYNEDINYIQTEYEANIELANGDAELEALAEELYQMKAEILNLQRTIDSEPFNEPLSDYLTESVYFYAIGFIVLMTILSVATSGKTPGRWLVKVRLASDRGNGEYGNPNPIQVFFHDIMIKYFFLVLVFSINLFYGLVFIALSVIVDLILISFTKEKSTIRDYFLRLKVIKAGYGY